MKRHIIYNFNDTKGGTPYRVRLNFKGLYSTARIYVSSHNYEEARSKAITLGSKLLLLEGVDFESQFDPDASKKLTDDALRITKRDNSCQAYFDGAFLHKKRGSYGAVIFQDGKIIWQDSNPVLPTEGEEISSNLAEYAGYIAVLQELEKGGLKDSQIVIKGDSKLVIMQIDGKWRIKNGLYVPFALKAKELTERFSNLKLKWIPREQNTLADKLASQVLHK